LHEVCDHTANDLHTKASAWFAENGLIEEAPKHVLAGENSKAAAQLIVTHGFDLLNDEQWPRLERREINFY
jgi:ATP/maltotriose-dependent transcriptional regulator MalT